MTRSIHGSNHTNPDSDWGTTLPGGVIRGQGTVRKAARDQYRIGAALSALLAIALLLLPACTTQTTTVNDRPGPTPDRLSAEAPKDLHDLAGFLLKYQAANFRLPQSLAQLRAEGFMPMDGYPGLSAYAYRDTGMGSLADGQEIVVVDTAVRVDDHLWCILREPNPQPRAAALNVQLVPLEDLRAAARQGR